jgi:hypothetical protein
MKTRLHSLSFILCFLLVISNAHGREGVLNAIPQDVLGFAIIHNLDEAGSSFEDLAKLVQAPLPDLLNWVKERTGLREGLDEQGDAALVLTNIDGQFKLVVLLPVDSFDDFFASLNSVETDGIVEVQIAGASTVVARQGDYAALASVRDRDELERFVASTTNLTIDSQLASWLDANKASIVVTRRGVEQLLPKLIKGIRDTQDKIRAVAGENGQAAAAGLELYVNLFTAAEAEVEQLGIGLRIDSLQTVDLMKLVQFKSGGDWAQWAANAKSVDGDLLAGFPDDPFVIAIAGVFSPEAMDSWMKFSVKLMQNQPGFQLSPEQAEKYVRLSTEMVRSVRGMRMVMGLPEPGNGLYDNTSIAMTVDDAPRFIEDYEESLSAMSQLAQEIKSPLIPTATSQRVLLDETQAIEITMKLPDMAALTPAGGPDMQTIMQHMFGAKDQLHVFMAAADEHTMLGSYTSLERLKAALDFYQAKRSGLSENAGVAKVAAAMPLDSQFVAYISLSGVAEVVRQFATVLPGINASAIPDVADCPPIGVAAKVAPSGFEGHLVIAAETLQTVGNTIAKTRATLPDTETPAQ